MSLNAKSNQASLTHKQNNANPENVKKLKRCYLLHTYNGRKVEFAKTYHYKNRIMIRKI